MKSNPLNENLPPVGYTWGIPQAVAFLDILGFQSASEYIEKRTDDPFSREYSSGDMAMGLWVNCVPSKEKLSHSPVKLNYVQMSDSLVIYGDRYEDVINLVCDVFGSALVWGVPIRGAIGYGILNHSENFSRPGTNITFYGSGLNDACQTEKKAKNLGMRLFISEKFIAHSKLSTKCYQKRTNGLLEYQWWHQCGVKSDHFRQRVDAWWTKKDVRKWFKGLHRKDTEELFEYIIRDLQNSESNLADAAPSAPDEFVK